MTRVVTPGLVWVAIAIAATAVALAAADTGDWWTAILDWLDPGE